MTKTAKKKAQKADVETVTPPAGFVQTHDLRTIDGVLHQKYVPHANVGGEGEHWQPIDEYETDAKTGETSQVEP